MTSEHPHFPAHKGLNNLNTRTWGSRGWGWGVHQVEHILHTPLCFSCPFSKSPPINSRLKAHTNASPLVRLSPSSSELNAPFVLRPPTLCHLDFYLALKIIQPNLLRSPSPQWGWGEQNGPSSLFIRFPPREAEFLAHKQYSTAYQQKTQILPECQGKRVCIPPLPPPLSEV